MSMPDVSFVVTVYNKRSYLPLLIKSLQAQRGLSKDCEYIFVDDGSTDGSFELLKTLTSGFQNLTLLQKENGGQTSALNLALQRVTKSYIKLWDADDYAHPDLTASLIAACETLDTELAFCHISYSSFDQPDDPQAILTDIEMMRLEQPEILPHSIITVLRNPVTNPTGLLIKKSLLDKIGLIDERIAIPDVYLTYAAALFTPFAHVEGAGVFAFRDVPGRLTGNAAQTLHDINGALYCLYDHFHTEIPYNAKRFIGKRATRRAWAWARQHNGKTVFSSEFFRFMWARINPFPPSQDLLYRSVLPFRVNQKVRTSL
jgi:glycosyltransferase involved in cell wall biosynthesis